MTKRFKIFSIVFVALIVFLGGVFGAYKLWNGASDKGPGAYDYEEYDYPSEPYAAGESSAKIKIAQDESFFAPTPMADGRNTADGDIATGDVVVQRLIIKTGTLSIVVNDVRDAVNKISVYATSKGGFVVSSNVYKDGLYTTGDITVRIPSEGFDEGMNTMKNLGEVSSESSYGQDVTEEFVDLDAQLGNLKATETQFLEIMKKAYEIEDILAVQTQLSYTRSEIERIEGRMKYLSESARLSTVTVYLSTDASALPVIDQGETWKPYAVVKDAVRSLIDFGKTIVDKAIWVVVYLPVIAVSLLIIWGIYRLIRRIFRKKKK